MQNPIKFAKVMNTKSGVPHIIPLSTWERLSHSPKHMKNLEFMFNCDENGNIPIDVLPKSEKDSITKAKK